MAVRKIGAALLLAATIAAAAAQAGEIMRVFPLRYADARQLAAWLGGKTVAADHERLLQSWANDVIRRAVGALPATPNLDAAPRWLTFVDVLPAQPGDRTAGALASVLDIPDLPQPPIALEWNNSLLVRGTPEQLDRLAEIIRLLDQPMPMVNIEVRVEDAPVHIERGWGLDWHVFNGQIDAGGRNAPAGDLTLSWARGRADVLLSLFDRVDRARTTIGVNVTTTSGMPAEIAFGQVLPFFTASITYDAFGNRHVDYVVNAVFVGVQLWCLPTVTASDMVRVTIRPTFSFGAGQVTSPRGESIPIVTYQTVATTVMVPDGESIIIGGLARARNEAHRRFAGLLHDIRVTESSNPVMILTPRIIRPMPEG